MFLESSAMERSIFFSKWMRVVDLCKNSFFDNIFRSQYLFEIYHTSLNIKNSENVIKRGCFWKVLRWRAFFLMKEECKVSCAKMFLRWFIRKSVKIYKIFSGENISFLLTRKLVFICNIKHPIHFSKVVKMC